MQQSALAQVREARITGVAERIAGELAGAPILQAGQVAAEHGLSHQGAMNALRRLAGLGLVAERLRNRRITFQADPVIQLLSR